MNRMCVTNYSHIVSHVVEVDRFLYFLHIGEYNIHIQNTYTENHQEHIYNQIENVKEGYILYTHIHTYLCAYIYTYLYAYIYTHLHAQAYTHACTHACTYIKTYCQSDSLLINPLPKRNARDLIMIHHKIKSLYKDEVPFLSGNAQISGIHTLTYHVF